MAEAVGKYEFNAVERGWLKKSLESQRSMLIRSRQKELTGSDVWVLRGKEIEFLTVLISRF